MRAYSKVFAVYLSCAALLTWMLFASGLVELLELPGFEGATNPTRPTAKIAEPLRDAPETASRSRGSDVQTAETGERVPRRGKTDVAAAPERLYLPGPVPPAPAPIQAVAKPEPAPQGAPEPPAADARPSKVPVPERAPPPRADAPARVDTKRPLEVARAPEPMPPAEPVQPVATEAARPVPPPAPPKTTAAPPPRVTTPPPVPPRTVELAPVAPLRQAPVAEVAPPSRAVPGRWMPMRRIAGFGADALVDQLEDTHRPADDLPCVAFEQVRFRVGTAQPFNGSVREIALIAESLAAFPSVRVEIGSRIGTNRLTPANQTLAVQRAAYVRNAIMARGIPLERLAVDTAASYHTLIDDLSRIGAARAPSIGVCIRPAIS